MIRFILPLAVASVALSGCIIDAGDDWPDDSSLEMRTRLATDACGPGNVKSVSREGFTCKDE
ncbi:MAG: hypothetical protein AAF511_09895 [Pseudomonadota bacterium]